MELGKLGAAVKNAFASSAGKNQRLPGHPAGSTGQLVATSVRLTCV
jgi:hypothetical protein